MADENLDEYTKNDKLKWEVEKLKAEALTLKRPYVKMPSSWITIMTIILGLFGIGIQYSKSDREYQLAEIKRQQATLETEQTKTVKLKVLDDIAETKKTLRELQLQREEASQKLNQLRDKVSQLEIRASNLSSLGEIKQVVQEVKESINNLDRINEQAASQSEQTTQNLQLLGTTGTDKAGLLPAFAVIASYKTREGALEYARRLQTQGLDYAVEVYQRDPHRFAITLGGYLTSEEAQKRVDYANQRGISRDAYVRLAKNWGERLLK